MENHVFTWDWCCMCRCAFVRCWKCGNNSCNGGYGELEDGSKCDVCPEAYRIQEEAYANGTVPEVPHDCPEMKWASELDLPVDLNELASDLERQSNTTPPMGSILDFGPPPPQK